MEHNIKDYGRMICSMVKELKHGQMGQGTMVSMHLEENMVLVLINGMMAHNTLVSGKKIRSPELVFTHG
jgi:hypothetical protein